jgi:hypothetical protein
MLLRSAYVAFAAMLAMLFACKAAMPKGLDLALSFLLATIVLTKPKV